MKNTTIFDQYKDKITHIAKTLQLDDVTRDALLVADNIAEQTLEITRDDGSQETLAAYRVQFSNARGPYKGGIRFHDAADLDEVSFLAALMALKTAVVGIPMGGGKGGVVMNAKDYSQAELERIARAWVGVMSDIIGVDQDIPAPDMYTTPQIMGYMLDEYEKITGKNEPGMITGKPIALGGSVGRDTATAQGGVYVLEELVNKLELDRSSLRVAIQGFGNSGYHAAKILYDLGYTIVAVSDSRNGIYDEKGIDPEYVMTIKKDKGSVADVPNVQVMSNAGLLACDCDVLIPAALDRQITKDNADAVQAKIIVELANGPVTADADEILDAKGIHIIPDILANAGGVTVSYFEWVQNRMQYMWDADEVKTKLKSIMVPAFHDVWEQSKNHDISMRNAAYMIAVMRIVEALRLRGRV
jgi:glutamate dehydrogenase/leucine dehydrogenase